MKKALLLLTLVFSCPAWADGSSQPGKSDDVSDMHKPFYSRDEKAYAEKLKKMQDVTGQEWLELTLGQRMDQMLASMYVLQARGVTLRKSINDYCNIVEKKLLLHSSLYSVPLTDILSGVVGEKK